MDKFKAEGYDPEGYTLYTYAAIQMYAAAVPRQQAARTTRSIAEWLRAGNPVPTVLGDIVLDAKGDIKDAKYVWYKFANGTYAEDPSINNPRIS